MEERRIQRGGDAIEGDGGSLHDNFGLRSHRGDPRAANTKALLDKYKNRQAGIEGSSTVAAAASRSNSHNQQPSNKNNVNINFAGLFGTKNGGSNQSAEQGEPLLESPTSKATTRKFGVSSSSPTNQQQQQPASRPALTRNKPK